MDNMEFKNLKFCPFCGSAVFYQIDYVKGRTFYRFTNAGLEFEDEVHNEDMHDGISYYMKKKDSGYYCENCGKKLGDRITGKVTRQVLRKIKEVI